MNGSQLNGGNGAKKDAASESLQLPLPSANLRRLDGVQMLRAFAVASVAWLHAGQLTVLLGAARGLPDLGISGVDLFFVISGFILCLLTLRDKKLLPGRKAAWSFLQRRAARIFPVYWIFAAPAIAHHVHHGWADSAPYLPALLLLPTRSYPYLLLLANFSWTLVFEVFFYLVLACILLVTVEWAPEVLIGLLTLLVGVGVLVGIQRPLLMVICSPMLLEFAFGGLVAVIYAKTNWASPKLGRILVAAGCMMAILLETFRWAWIAPYQDQILAGHGVMARAFTWGIASALVVAGIVFWSPSLKSPVGRASVALGNASYSTYLLSGLLLLDSVGFFYRFGQSRPVRSFWLLPLIQIGIVAVLMCLGVLFYVLIERRLIRWAYHLFTHANARDAG